MREISAKELFDNWYHTYEDDVAKMGWTVGDMVYQLLEHDVKDGDKLFEFGIGTGSLSNKFSSVANIAVSGCDISPNMLSLCRDKYGIPSERLFAKDVSKDTLPVEGKSFDHSICCGVLEYVEDIGNLISEMARITKSGGNVIVCCETNTESNEKIALRQSSPEGVFFNYYQHPVSQIESIFSSKGVTPVLIENFESVGNGEPINYTLYQGLKLPSP